MMKGAVFATRGCPYHCSYCNLKQIYRKGFRTRPAGEVAEEIQKIKSKHFVFWDDHFFANKEYALELMKLLAPLKKKWAAQVVLQSCDDELLAAARQAGCTYLFVGLESFSDASLADAGKQINRTEMYREIIQKLHSYKILVQAGIVFGFDSDGPDVLEKTLRVCEELGIDGATVSILTPLPKTPIYEQFKNSGRLSTTDWSRYNGKTDVAFLPKNMTQEELYRGYAWFRKQFYSFSCFIRRIRNSRLCNLYTVLINLGYRLALRKS
ncbi:MAG: radical SAM protein, partial [Eubacteriales bacterium]